MILTAPVLDRPPREVLRWRAALFAVFLVSGFLITSLVSRLPTVRDLLDASTGKMGFLILGISSSSVVTLPLSGYVVARLGATRTVAVFSVVAALGLVAAGAVATFAPFLAGTFLALVVLSAGNSGLNVAVNVSGAAFSVGGLSASGPWRSTSACRWARTSPRSESSRRSSSRNSSASFGQNRWRSPARPWALHHRPGS